MSSPRIDARHYTFSDTDRLFLDANIWLFLYGINEPGSLQVSTYSKIFQKIRNANARIFVDAVVMSEFINRQVMFHYNRSGQKNKKAFRNSAEFLSISEGVAETVRRVLRDANRVDSSFAGMDCEEMLRRFQIGGCDFNDEIIANLCAEQGLMLLTDDRDFSGVSIPLMTANDRLLNKQ